MPPAPPRLQPPYHPEHLRRGRCRLPSGRIGAGSRGSPHRAPGGHRGITRLPPVPGWLQTRCGLVTPPFLSRLPAAPEAGRGASPSPLPRSLRRVPRLASGLRRRVREVALQPPSSRSSRWSGRGGPGPAMGEPRPTPLSSASPKAVLGVPVRPRPSPGGASLAFQSEPAPGEEFTQNALRDV